MNDEQREKMLTALGRAFDKAAISCSHERQAAMRIVAALAEAGFKITPAAKSLKSPERPVRGRKPDGC